MMSLDSSNELQKQFKQFWEFAETQATPLLRVQPIWEYWWKKNTRQREEIKRIVASMSENEQESFVKWVEDWIGPRFPWRNEQCGRLVNEHPRREAGRLVLVQLAQIPLFESWACLKPYRLENLKGINAIILQSKDGGQSDDVKPLIVLLIPKEAGDPNYAKPNMNVSDVALLAMEKSRNAALSLLSGVGLLLLLMLWGLLGRKPRRWWILHGIGWTVVASIFSFLLISPAAFVVDAILVPMLWTLVAVTGLLVLYGFWSNFREVLLAWKWTRLLRQSQLCLLVGGAQTKNHIEVDGPSFGVALCLSILLALHEECPATAEGSWLWWQIFEQLVKRLLDLVATGEVTNRGWLKPVGRMEHKIEALCDQIEHKTEASCDQSAITVFTPVQKEVPRTRVVQRPNTAMSLSTCVGQAAGVSELRLHRCYHIAHVLLAMGGLINAFAATRNIVVALLLVVIAVASPDIFWLLYPPPDPEWVFGKCGFGNLPEPDHSGDLLRLYFETDHPTHFGVYFNSRYWANREKQLDRAKEPHYGDAMIELVKLDDSQDSHYDGEIQLIRYRKFLFRPLPPVIIEQILLWHCLKKRWEAQNSESGELPRPYSKGFETLPPSHSRIDKGGI